MRGYFKPLRRKIGVLTLVMACLLLGGWMRSLVVCDVFGLPVGKHVEQNLASEDSVLLWSQNYFFAPPYPTWSTIPLQKHRPDTNYEFYNVKWTWRIGGFGFGARRIEITGRPVRYQSAPVVTVPYWFLVLPLTLLSAWLLLLKRRQPTKPEPSQGPAA